jgi:hypothetical protein
MPVKTPAIIPTLFICLTCIAFATGCKTIDPASASKFATSVATVKTQADGVLLAAATLTRTQSITFAALQPTLSEDEFVETPSSDVIEGWDNALSSIETYALNLAALSSPDATKSFDAAATNLFNQMTQTATRLNSTSLSSSPEITAGLATAFTETAHLILGAKAQATARKVAAATDPKINSILNLLASEIGDDHANPGLRTTIYRAWNTERDALSGPFLKAASQTAKEDVARQYATLLAERDAEDESLASLRHVLLALADAHHALAQGETASVQATLTITINELQRTQNLVSQFNADLKAKN